MFPFRYDFEVEIGVRHTYYSLLEVDLDNTVALYNLAFDTFRNSAYAQQSYAIFLFVSAKPEEYNTIASAIKRSKKLK